jgi:hypothetical protein
VRQDQKQEISAGCSERYPNPKLLRSLGSIVGQQDSDTDHSKQERGDRERGQ